MYIYIYIYTWYIIYKHTITVLFQVPRRIVPSSPTKTTRSATPWTAQSRSTRHGASHRSPRCPCGASWTWKNPWVPKANGNPNLVHRNFSWKFSSRKCGHRNSWYGFLRNSELSLFIIRCSMLLISYLTQNGRLVISVQSQIPCAKRSHKKRNEASPDLLWSKFPNIKSHPTPVGSHDFQPSYRF